MKQILIAILIGLTTFAGAQIVRERWITTTPSPDLKGTKIRIVAGEIGLNRQVIWKLEVLGTNGIINVIEANMGPVVLSNWVCSQYPNRFLYRWATNKVGILGSNPNEED